MNILLVRHGETAWNREGRYQGRTDIPLSETGQTQVRALGERLKSVEIKIAYASPLSRAKNTADAILAGRTTPLWLEPGLLEISHGDWEGQLASDVEISHAEMFGVWRTRPGRTSPAGPNAETLGDVETRAWAVLDRICDQLTGDETALIAAHDAVNRVLLCRVMGLPLERIWSFRQAPASLNVLSGPSIAELQVVRLNDAEHVAPLLREAKHRAV
jgi:broad specificity phosphatase PhoE